MRLRVVALVLAGLAALAVPIAWPAAAHSAVVVTPAGGTVLAAAPQSVRIAQAAPVEPGLVQAQVRGPRGAQSRDGAVGADDPQAIVVTVPPDGPGTYRVAWSGMTTDGHALAGTSAFAVRRAEPVAAPVMPAGADGAGPMAVIARLLVLIGVLGTAGMALAREWVMARAWAASGIAPPGAEGADRLRDHARAAAPGPVARWWRAWWALIALWVVGLAIALPVQAAAVDGAWGDLLGGTRWGTAWMGLLALAAIGAIAALVLRGGEPSLGASGARMYVLVVPGLLGAVLLSWSGHAASGTDATLGTAIDIVHGWATAAWLGGLVMLMVLALPLLRALGPDDRVRLGAGVVVRFSAVAVGAVLILVITGVYRALAELPSLSALWSTAYGLALLAKLVVFGVMLVLAAWNRLVLHPRLERVALGLEPPGASDGLPALAASVRAEVLLGAAVLLAVAVMVGLMPPT
ncbi:MAG: hypothetical protein FJW92_05650 [Actinobacteria bacterium]|nr:hypothetical protein [Actinomycetota bacterium]